MTLTYEKFAELTGDYQQNVRELSQILAEVLTEQQKNIDLAYKNELETRDLLRSSE